jgi:hypothetical protein
MQAPNAIPSRRRSPTANEKLIVIELKYVPSLLSMGGVWAQPRRQARSQRTFRGRQLSRVSQLLTAPMHARCAYAATAIALSLTRERWAARS